MTNPIVMGTNVKYIDDGNTRMVCITQNVSTASSPLSLEENGTDYAVPAGKIFIPIRLHLQNSSTTANVTCELHYNTTTDSTTGSTLWSKVGTTSSSTLDFEYGAPEIPANNYVILRNAASGNFYVTMIGVETNA